MAWCFDPPERLTGQGGLAHLSRSGEHLDEAASFGEPLDE